MHCIFREVKVNVCMAVQEADFCHFLCVLCLSSFITGFQGMHIGRSALVLS